MVRVPVASASGVLQEACEHLNTGSLLAVNGSLTSHFVNFFLGVKIASPIRCWAVVASHSSQAAALSPGETANALEFPVFVGYCVFTSPLICSRFP